MNSNGSHRRAAAPRLGVCRERGKVATRGADTGHSRSMRGATSGDTLEVGRAGGETVLALDSTSSRRSRDMSLLSAIWPLFLLYGQQKRSPGHPPDRGKVRCADPSARAGLDSVHAENSRTPAEVTLVQRSKLDPRSTSQPWVWTWNRPRSPYSSPPPPRW